MTKEEIMAILPHRDNMLLIDEVVLEAGVARGSYTVRGDEWFLAGHFPGNPVVPGVILCEILAQSACLLLDREIISRATPYLAAINSAKIKTPVKPGDIAETECSIIRTRPPFYFTTGKLCVGGKLCLKAEFTFVLI